jgi:hypothetical protein
MGLGFVRDNPEIAIAMAAYLTVKLAEGIKPQGAAVKAMPSGPWEDR